MRERYSESNDMPTILFLSHILHSVHKLIYPLSLLSLLRKRRSPVLFVQEPPKNGHPMPHPTISPTIFIVHWFPSTASFLIPQTNPPPPKMTIRQHIADREVVSCLSTLLINPHNLRLRMSSNV